MAAEISVEITKTFPGRATIDVLLTLPLDPPSVTILFGPSGSGKTTVLRCLAGLEQPERGHISCNGRRWFDAGRGIHLPPQARDLGYMSQDYALFPHYSVAENVEYGLGALEQAERAKRVDEVLHLLHIEDLARHRPRQLSGGQQQRVALARAIARRPRLLLLDEPLSSLDAPTRGKLSGELRLLLKRLAIPAVVVTHDWAEALTLGDRIAVISGGRVVQIGSPQDVFSRPVDADVARIVGVETVVQGRMRAAAEGLATVEVGSVSLTAVGTSDLGPDVFVCIRAEDVTVERAGFGETSARNHVEGTVRAIHSLGALARVTIDCGFLLSALITRSALTDLQLAIGTPVKAAFKAGAVHLIPRR
jgi:molybdate transport system ATP-binding protein